MAVTEGFEPSIQFPVCILSRDVVSATHPRHRFTNAVINHIMLWATIIAKFLSFASHFFKKAKIFGKFMQSLARFVMIIKNFYPFLSSIFIKHHKDFDNDKPHHAPDRALLFRA